MRALRAIRLIHAALLIGSALTFSATADTVAVAVDTGHFGGLSRGTGVSGWQFAPRQNLVVTSMGLYDTPGFGGFWGDGLLEQHSIGIWNVAAPETPVAMVVLPSGVETLLRDGVRLIAVDPFQLTAGNEYVIGAMSGNVDPNFGDFAANYFPMTTDPALEFMGRRFGGLQSETLVFPEYFEPGVAGEFGPNFMFVVPEPSVAGLLLLGSLGIASKLRKEKRK